MPPSRNDDDGSMQASKVFNRISATLDRSFRYLIVGCHLHKKALAACRDIVGILESCGIGVLDESVHRDLEVGLQYTVFKLDRDAAQNLDPETLYALMPENVTWYLYEKVHKNTDGDSKTTL